MSTMLSVCVARALIGVALNWQLTWSSGIAKAIVSVLVFWRVYFH
jgi:hypothetical protein